MAKEVFLVRHGETDSNVDHIFRGRDAKLSELGEEQARTVAKRIEKIGVDALVASHFLRAQQTAQAISEQIALPVETNELFGEWREPTSFYGKNHSDEGVVGTYHEILYGTDPAYRFGDEETTDEMVQRAKAALASIVDRPEERICIVTHAGFLRALVGVILLPDLFSKKLFTAFWSHMKAGNTGITHIEYRGEKWWRLISWNDRAHLG